MNNITITNKGTIRLGSKVMVSDPCYGLNTWCQGVLENVLPGDYECQVEHSDEGDWGKRVSAIEVTHIDYKGKPIESIDPQDFEVGVDSGQAGIFDYEYYTQYHSDFNERPHVKDDWYDGICDLTHSTIENPDYEEFEHKEFNLEDKSIENIQAYIDYIRAKSKYFDTIKSMKYITCPDGNTIDGVGFVSSSGYGDGGYTCWTAENEDGQIVRIRVEFITEDYDEEDE